MSGSFGPMKLDFSSFYKFVASVGLVLLAASLLLPWFVLRASVPEAPPGTPASQIVDVALNERADQYRFIIQVYPWVSLGLFVLGCVLTGYGLFAWRGRQKKQDADEDEAYRQRRELGKTTEASSDDRERKLDREAEEEDAGAPDEVASTGSPSGGASRPPSSMTQPKNPADVKYRARRDFIAKAETRVIELMRRAFDDSHEVEPGVRIGGGDAPILDLVARAKDPSRWSSFAMEIKLFGASSQAQLRLRDAMISIAVGAREVPEGQVQVQRVGRPPIAKSVSLCLVILEDPGVQSASVVRPMPHREFVERAARIVRVVNSVLLRKVGIIIITQSRFSDISADWLRRSVLEVMQHPEEFVLGDLGDPQ